MSADHVTPSASGTYSSRAMGQNLHPLWLKPDVFRHEPTPEPPCLWRWTDIRAFAEEAIGETDVKQAERRVLLLGNPAYQGQSITTRTLQGAIQVLAPGEAARPHRHTAGALRFILDDGGETYSVVDGKEVLMQRGDIVLTPGNCWHSHFHRGPRRSIWFDALDAPLVRHLDAGFHEPWLDTSEYPVTVGENDFSEVGFSPLLPDEMARGAAPRFLYPWEKTLSALRTATPRDDGSAWLRLTNPIGGRMALQLIDSLVVRLGRTATRPVRTTASVICVAAMGSGRSTIGDSTLDWTAGDIFTVPHWAWASHQAKDDEAALFMVTDRAALERLGLWRSEIG